MNFASDNWSGATEPVMAAIARHNGGFAPAYGGDPLTASVSELFAQTFETALGVHFVATGTAANALSLATMARPGGLVFASQAAHIDFDEFGATEMFTGGMKIIPVESVAGRMTPEAFKAALARYAANGRFGLPTVLSITQATENGTVYPVDTIKALADIAHASGLRVHLDGARFGNAVAALGVSPAEITWKAGVDIMSFGGTKNGCIGAEAILVFDPALERDLPVIRQRAGHVVSKARFVAAQFEGYLSDGNWLKTAGHANAMAMLLTDGIEKKNTARIAWRSEANEVFPLLSLDAIDRLREAGARFHEWPHEALPASIAPPDGEQLVRLVTSFATTEAEVRDFLALI